VEILTGPDRYDDGRQYLTVRVRMDGGLGRDVPGFLPDCARCGHPEDAHHVPGPDMLPRHCATPGCDCPGWRSAAGMAMDAPGPRLLPAPCSDYSPCVPYAPCETCGRTREAHRIAAAAAGEPWTDDNNDGGTP
jgi:ribosomal protein L32